MDDTFPLRDAARSLASLPSHVKIVAESLSSSLGHPSDCSVLFIHASLNNNWRQVWPIIFELLDPDRIPSNASNPSVYTYDERIAIEIAWLIVVEVAEADTLSGMQSDMEEIWERLWHWMVVFMQRKPYTPGRKAVDSTGIHPSLICLAVTARFLRHSGVHSRILYGTDAILLYIEAWTRCCKVEVRDNRWSRLGLLAIYDILRPMIPLIPSHISIVSDAAGASHSARASFFKDSFAVLRKLDDTIISDFAIVSVTCFWRSLDDTLDSRVLRTQLIKCGALGEMASALFALTKDLDFSDDRDSAVTQLLILMLKTSQYHWEFGSWSLALSNGGLDGTLTVMQRTRSTMTQRLTDMVLCAALGRGLWRISLLRAFAHYEFDRNLLRPTEAIVTQEHRGLVDAFVGCIDRRLQQLQGFADQVNRRMCWTCGRISEDGKLKRCGGCKETYYCNPSCQKDHWPVHREECHVRRFSQHICKLDSRTRAFVRYIMDEDLLASFSTLKNGVIDILTHEIDSTIVLVFDYRSPNFGVICKTGQECALDGTFDDYGGCDITTHYRRMGDRIAFDILKIAGQDNDYNYVVPRYSKEPMGKSWWETLNAEKVTQSFH